MNINNGNISENLSDERQGEIERKEENSMGNKAEIFSWIKSLAFAAGLAMIIVNYLFSFTVVSGSSMEPTLHNGDYCFMIRVPLYFRLPKYGEIVVFKSEAFGGKELVKRIVGLPGDEIHIEGGRVYRNGDVLEEKYIQPGVETEGIYYSDVKVPEDSVFVIGDNRLPGRSSDSRVFGPVPVKDLDGLINFRLYSKSGSIGVLNK